MESGLTNSKGLILNFFCRHELFYTVEVEAPPTKWGQANVIYLKLVITRESATLTCVLAKTQN